MIKILFTGILVLLFIVSCKELAEDYVGIPMQPKFNNDSGFEKRMNMFGIMRPDSSLFSGNSFICLVQTLLTKNDTTSDPFIKDAEVTLYQTDLAGKTDTIPMQYQPSPSDTSWHIPEYVAPSIHPNAGWKYKINIKQPNYPEVTGETTIPSKPKLEEGSLIANTSEISFTLKPDTAIYLYDVFLISDISIFNKRIVPEKDMPTHVELNTSSAGWNLLAIYAYDRNLSIYYSTSTNSFFSFNTYRPAITTVSGGFGCFGSLNFLEIYLH